MREYIKFTNFHVPRIIREEKTLTVRYGWDEELVHYPKLKDGDGDVFARADMRHTANMTIEEFVEKDYDGHRKYESPEDMIQKMQMFYDDELTPNTEVKVIWFELLKR